jgi:catechol 2,3-dioxygenase-like lactoylglutathione lyase family enzyme
MLGESKAFNGFAVDDLDAARRFYGETLGLRLTVENEEFGLMTLHLAGDRDTLVYLSPGMTPPSYTILNFPVDDIDQTVDDLSARGVSFEQYDNDDLPQDDRGIMREGGPLIAWFKDPAGNTLSVLQDR